MQRLYIDRQGAKLKVERGRIHICWPEQTASTSCPLAQVDVVVLAAPTELNSTVLAKLAAAEVDVVCLNRRNHDQSSISRQYRHGNVMRLVNQVNFTQSGEPALFFAQSLIRSKLRRQALLLRKMLQKRPDNRLLLQKGIQRVQQSQHAINTQTKLDSLLGIEGSAAKYYFESMASVYPASLKFKGRNRRPPRDPVNAVLSLGYTLLHNDCVRALYSAGFDPRLGVLHSLTYSRQSLACDLLELYRPLYDKVVWRWFAEQYLLPDHFSMDNNACLLNKVGRERFFPAYEKQAHVWRKSQRRLTMTWVRSLEKFMEQRDAER